MYENFVPLSGSVSWLDNVKPWELDWLQIEKYGVVLRCLFSLLVQNLENLWEVVMESHGGEINFWVLFSSPQYVFEIAVYIGNLEEIPDNFVAARESENFSTFYTYKMLLCITTSQTPQAAISGKSKKGGRSSRSFMIRGIKKSIMENT